jgi:hypothetical protein
MQIQSILIVSFLLLGFSGCSEHPDHVPVTVQINDTGKPVEGVSVTFVADDGSYATGFTDANGTAKMYTYKVNDGVKPGSYRIKLSKYEKAPAPADMYDPATDTAQPEFKPALLVPKKYIDAATSGLTATIEKKMPTLVFDVGE